MKLLKNKGMLLGIGIIFLLLGIIGISYAWFSASVDTKNSNTQVVETGTLELTYTDGPEIVMNNIKPGTTITKEVRVKNTGTLDTSYNLVWQELYNSIINDEMVMSISCTRLNASGKEEESCEGLDETPVGGNVILKDISITRDITHVYTVTITFKETNANQNYNQGKNFTGTLGVNEYREITPVYCTYDGDLTQGAEFTNGSYTYRYMQQYLSSYDYDIAQLKSNNDYNITFLASSPPTYEWFDMTEDGWGVRVKDEESTDAITNAPCTYINNKPIVSMSYMFYNSQAKTIDLSKANTSNVKSMHAMFQSARASEIKGLENFDTSNVLKMGGMFYSTYNLSSLDVSSFDTSNVTDMNHMFYESGITKINVSNFNTGNVTDMSFIFYGVPEVIGYEKFNTSKVTNMCGMFDGVQMSTIDVSGYNTSNVTDMGLMFGKTTATEIKGLENFDTSNVTDMGSMFRETKMYILDLSSFDTSKVVSADWMFADNPNLTTIYTSDKFAFFWSYQDELVFYNLPNLVGGAGTTFNSTGSRYAHIDGGTSNPGYFTQKN